MRPSSWRPPSSLSVNYTTAEPVARRFAAIRTAVAVTPAPLHRSSISTTPRPSSAAPRRRQHPFACNNPFSSSSHRGYHTLRSSSRISPANTSTVRRPYLPLLLLPQAGAGQQFRLASSNANMDTTTDRLYSRPEGVERLADSLEKPLLDNRTYRVIKLPNQLEALLIHDAETDKASAAMDVNVGSMSDPEDMQGIAHAVEHLLFMGTEKFPQENEYNSYLNKYAGNSNAFTAPTSTNYYFECSAMSTSNSRGSSTNTSQASLPISQASSTKAASPLWGALDRFSQFFVKPLFLEETLDRELRAVDSENKKNLQADNWRLMQLGKSLSSKDHAWHLFSTGNYKLLHDDPIARGVKIRDRFMKFYDDHYSANRMKLVVLGREDLDTLQGWVEELFSPVVNKNLPKLTWEGIPAFTEKELGLQIFVKPIMDTRMLDIMFPYPDQDDLYDSNPSRYISHLIGHEGPGSVLAYLKEKGWANELSAGAQTVAPGLGMFAIGLRLTAQGLKYYQEILKIIFQYISLIKEQPPQEWIVWESSKLAEIEFKFRQQIPASRATSHLSGLMQKPIRREWLLSGQTLIRKFDPEGIRAGLAAFRPDNFRFTLVSKEYPGDWDQKEKWYGTEYKAEKIPSDFMKELHAAASASASHRPAELHMPHKNEFIPTRLDVENKDVSEPALTPKLIRNDQNVRVWWKKDDQFWVPKGNVYLMLRSPILKASPVNVVLTQLYQDLVEDALSTYAYDAELAGLDYAITNATDCVVIEISGYNDKLHVLLEKVLRTMRDLDVRDDRFDIMKERKSRAFENSELADPYRQVNTYTRWIVKERQYIPSEMAGELALVTADQLRAFYPHFLSQMHIEMMAHGNFFKEEALKIADLVESIFRTTPFPPKQWNSERFLAFPPGSDHVFEKVLVNPDNVNHCIEYAVHVGDAQDRALRAKLLLISQLIDEPCFDTLRTKEQLGYVVGSGPIVWGNRLLHRILIQSEKDCLYLEKRIDAFLLEFEKTIQEMSFEQFEEQKIGVINKRLEKLKTLTQESARFWHHINSEQYDFELVYRDVEQLEELTKEDILKFFSLYFKPGSPTRAKHSIHLIAQASAEDVAAKIDPDTQRASLAENISSLLGQLGIITDADALSSSLNKVDLTKGTAAEDIVTAVGDYLTKAAGMAAEQVAAIKEQATAVLPQILPALGIKSQAAVTEPETNGHAASNGGVARKEPTKITDIKVFRDSLALHPASRAVKDISEFEEIESKL